MRTCALNEVHEIPRRLAIGLGLECDVQVRRRPQNMQQRPKSEPLTTVLRQAEVDLHVLDTGLQRFGRYLRQV